MSEIDVPGLFSLSSTSVSAFDQARHGGFTFFAAIDGQMA